MICRDCAMAADFDALPGLVKVGQILSANDSMLAGHELCRQREQRATAMQPPGCDCQHGESRCPTPISRAA